MYTKYLWVKRSRKVVSDNHHIKDCVTDLGASRQDSCKNINKACMLSEKFNERDKSVM